MNPATITLLLLLAPLASASLAALVLRRRPGLAAAGSVGAAGAIVVLASLLIFQPATIQATSDWLTLGSLTISLGFLVDYLAKLMLFVVAFVGFLIHVFSLGYMRDDGARARYFGGLSMFMFSMLGIVVADNLFMIFIFWELVGFSSYLLIGHYQERSSAADAAKKAFIVNRIGDFGFILGIVWCQAQFGTTNLAALSAAVASGDGMVATGLPLLLFCGAIGKSAQFPLQVWLPDAMEGPTPVSALIHAATMVAAGIYLLCRINVLMVPRALDVIMIVGTGTAFYAALCAIVQRDIKKILAYSTLSQLGYMVAAFGLGSLVAKHDHAAMPPEQAVLAAGVAAAMFHLTTHGFFKALLFLGAGSVIAGCHHEQDIFRMGGLWRRMPLTFGTFTIGVLAIIGMPGFAGFFSKDAILLLAFAQNRLVFAVLTVTAVLTAFYMVRMWKIAFFGAARSDEAEHAHESGWVMTLPLVLLALLSVVGGYTGFFRQIAGSLAAQRPEAEGVASLARLLILSIGIVALGGGAAWIFYRSAAADRLEEKAHGTFVALTYAQKFFDRLYEYYVAKIQQRFAMVLNFIDQIFIAGLARMAAGFVGALGLGARALHVGSLHGYVYWFLIGALLLWAIAIGII